MRKMCSWCGHPKKLFWIHKECIKRPNYHDQKADNMWINHPERPTRDGQRTMRKLTEDELLKLADMEEDDYL